MGALHAYPEAVGQFEVTVEVDGLVVLADLIVLGHVRIEVVLSVKDGWLHPAVQGRPYPHCVLHGHVVEHRQRPWQAQANRANVGVGLVAELVGA